MKPIYVVWATLTKPKEISFEDYLCIKSSKKYKGMDVREIHETDSGIQVETWGPDSEYSGCTWLDRMFAGVTGINPL
jgi:hypothetical protein